MVPGESGSMGYTPANLPGDSSDARAPCPGPTAERDTNARRRVARRGAPGSDEEWAFVDYFLREDWSPEQIVGWCTRFGLLAISHEPSYRPIWTDRKRGGSRSTRRRVVTKKYRKRYAAYDSRGRLAGQRRITGLLVGRMPLDSLQAS